ncbi:LOG family protein [Candidatus Shapirobacteria bacterium]|nr:LOG family protein [Candidatus Shapirobacteria bacterium]
MNVSIFGYSEAKEGEGLYQEAKETARLLALSGFNIINGAGPGVMRAATEGAHRGGGQAIGVCFNPVGMTNFEGRDRQNRVDKLIETPDYVSRTLKLLELGDFYVVFNGGTGTISEFGMAWGLARLYFGNHKPMVLFGRFWEEIIEAFKKNMLLRPEEMRVYEIVETPQEANEAVKRFARER